MLNRYDYGQGGTMTHHANGNWVFHSDAEEEIEKARKEGNEEGHASSGSWMASKEEEVRSDEREKIADWVRNYAPSNSRTIFMEMANDILSLGAEKKPGKIEKLPTIYHAPFQEHDACVVDKINELIDFVNGGRE